MTKQDLIDAIEYCEEEWKEARNQAAYYEEEAFRLNRELQELLDKESNE